MTTAYFESAKANFYNTQDVKAKTKVPSPKKASIPTQTTESVSAEEPLTSLCAALGIPSGKRCLIALVAGLLAGACVSYVASSLTAYLVVGAAVMTGSAFLAFMCLFVGYVLTILVSLIAGVRTLTFVAFGGVDRCYEKVSTSVVGVFSSFKNKMSWSAS